ncbi:aldehyde dehydrogenase [Paenarthrobacter ilicis]|uniref:aldehyde dehydrogenase n=1 Tax=Paenarthrobacter ilicis TaxID=43665 RepID=UPI0028D69898|nr:aldehyde dehydrogenase [Paenarthrobacter ilicis]
MTTQTLPIEFTQAYIGGDFVDAGTGKTFVTVAPATGEELAQVASCSAEDVDRAVAAARAAFIEGTWSAASPADRKVTLLKLADLIEENSQHLALLEAMDAGKTITDTTEMDIPETVATFRWYAEAIDKVFGKISPTREDSLGLIVREPVGVVAAILPWNFPAMTMAWKVAPALAAGNSVIVKPAELSPLSALYIAELTKQAGIPDGVFNVVTGHGSVVGQALGRHNDVDVLSFTGSTEVGRLLLSYSADSNLKQVILECGGKSPQIVFPDLREDLQTVAEDLAVAAFTAAGQNCTAGSRVLVHSSIADELVDRLTEAAKTWVTGDPLDPATRLGPLIETSAKERVLSYIDGAERAGARIRAGGGRPVEETGLTVEATVIDNVTPDMAVARDEIFGPVVSVLTFDDEAEAIAIANDTDYGLAATVWTRDIDLAVRVARAVKAGTVAVNGYSEGDMSTPFGGYRQSGFGGRDNGLEAFDQYTELKTIWITLR